MPGDEAPEKIHTLPFVPPMFDWSAQNLYTQFRIFKTKVDFAINGTHRNNANEAKVGAILNWMGDSAFKVYTFYGLHLLTKMTQPKCLLNLKTISNKRRMYTIAGIC